MISFVSQINKRPYTFFNEFSFGATRGPDMLVKYANFVKIQPIAPDKGVRPKASNSLVDLIEPLSLK